MVETVLQYSRGERFLIIISVMTATLMQVLDTTIVNVALPHMQGSLSATPDQITWTLTSYLVASAVFMPLTGYFSDRLGRKKHILICIAGFTISSALCGLSTSLLQLVGFRLLQGVFGAALVPLSQAILTDIYPFSQRGKAMAIWGVGVMVGPILGPTLGGYLTEIANWRWNFYVNVPVGIFAFLIASQVVPDTIKRPRYMDWIGLFLLTLGIGGAQYFLDRGNQQDWFNARDIKLAALFCVFGITGFILHRLINRNHRTVFDVHIFRDRNFTVASLLLAGFGLGMFGVMVIQPLMLENLLNYPVLTTGLVMAPRGISGMLSMFFVGKLITRVDAKWLIAAGILICALGIYICTFFSFNISPAWVIGPLLLQGFGLGMIFVPLAAVAFTTLPPELRVEGAGLYSLLRTIGASVGISLSITFFSRHAQMGWNQLGGHITAYNPAVNEFLKPLNLTISNPLGAAILGEELSRQSQMLGFVNTFAFITWSFLMMLPLVLFLKKSKTAEIPPMVSES